MQRLHEAIARFPSDAHKGHLKTVETKQDQRACKVRPQIVMWSRPAARTT